MTSKSDYEWAYQISDSLSGELREFNRQVTNFRVGNISETEFRAFRVPMGVYEQRESGTYMLRVRLPAGIVTPSQMRGLASVAESCGSGVLHVTTRQDIQVHGVPLQATHAALVALSESGLSTQGGGGNTVRNVTSCSEAGVCAKELFDVRPYTIALTERLLQDPLSLQLPRKYKIAFSGCEEDCAAASVNDLGFVAREKGGEAGFAVYVGGGMGSKSRVGELLHEFIPVADAAFVAEAIKRVFDKHGDRRNKNKARLRFVVSRLGFDAFRDLYTQELESLRVEGVPQLNVRTIPSAQSSGRVSGTDRGSERLPGYADWRHANVLPQKQPEFHFAIVPLALGDIDAKQFAALADIVGNHGDGVLHTTQSQNLIIRWLQEAELPVLHCRLAELGLAEPVPEVLRNLVVCAGASTCRLGLCQSRGLADAIKSHLRGSSFSLRAMGDIRINISGCPNSCGRHPIADIGLYGAARRVDDRLVPHYFVQLGGRVSNGRAQLGEVIGAVPAKSVPGYVGDLLKAWTDVGGTQSFSAYVRDEGRVEAERLLARHSELKKEDIYLDWGSDEVFSLAGRGPAECGAGVFDLIEVDLTNAREAAENGRSYRATVLAARALLVTKGEHPKSDAKAIELFLEHFVDQGLVNHEYWTLLEGAISNAATPNPEAYFAVNQTTVCSLVSAVTQLYESMDVSLRFKPLAPRTRTT